MLALSGAAADGIFTIVTAKDANDPALADDPAVAEYRTAMTDLGFPADGDFATAAAGWTGYVPLTERQFAIGMGQDLWILGLHILGISSIMGAVNFLVTIHRMRAPGMTWFRLPLFVWALYATSLIQVLGTPVVAITIVLVAAERIFGFGLFNPAVGGDPAFAYSPVLKAAHDKGETWSKERLDEFLKDPQALYQGTWMGSPPVRDAKQRADILCVLGGS